MYSAYINKLTFTHEEAKECARLILEELQSDQLTVEVLNFHFPSYTFFLNIWCIFK
jgi:hypothetical protein